MSFRAKLLRADVAPPLSTCKRKRPGRAEVGLVGIACLLLTVHSSLYAGWIVDDAAISFTYARGLWDGGVFSLFPGGERTEGFSNFLWVVLLAPVAGLLGDQVGPAVQLLSIGLQLGSILLVWHLTRAILSGHHPVLHTLPAFLLAANWSFVAWGVSGLENPLYSLLILLSVACVQRRGRHAYLAVSLLVAVALTRPEGVGYTALGVSVLVAGALLTHGPSLGSRLRQAGALVLLAVAPILAFLAWRWSYFHDLVPNPYYAKLEYRAVEGSALAPGAPGVEYVQDALVASGGLVLPVLALVGLLTKPGQHAVVLSGLFAIYSLFFAAWSGGDWMMGFRFLSTFYPLLAVLGTCGLAYSLTRLGPLHRSVRLPVGAVGAVLLVLQFHQGFRQSRAALEQPTIPMDVPMEMARSIRIYADHLGLAYCSVFMPDLGGSSWFGYGNDLEVLDLAGLANRFTGLFGQPSALQEYVVDLATPDFVEAHGDWSIRAQLHRSDQFLRDYRPIWEAPELEIQARGPSFGGMRKGLYVRREHLIVDELEAFRPLHGRSVGAARPRGWRWVQAGRRGMRGPAIELAIEVGDGGVLPGFSLEKQDSASGEVSLMPFKLAGGSYSVEFREPGDVVRTVLGPFEEAEAAAYRLVLTLDEDRLIIPLVDDEPVSGHGRVVENVEDQLRRLDALYTTGRLEEALELVVTLRRTAYLPGDAGFADMARRLSELYEQRADSLARGLPQERLSAAPLVWAAYWRAFWAEPANSRALSQALEWYRLARVQTGALASDLLAVAVSPLREARQADWEDVYGQLTGRPLPGWRLIAGSPLDGLEGSHFPPFGFDPVYLAGWRAPEQWGRWMSSTRSTLLLSWPAEKGGTLRIRATAPSSATPLPSCELFLDGELLAQLRPGLPAWAVESHDVELPASDGVGILCFECAPMLPSDAATPFERVLPMGDPPVQVLAEHRGEIPLQTP